MSLYELFSRSKIRDDKLLSLTPSSLFNYQSSGLWIRCRKSEIDFTTSIQSVKSTLKDALLKNQSSYGTDWHNFNFDIEHFEF